jgi:hypothetical protein
MRDFEDEAAEELFRECPDRALAGGALISAESDPENDRSLGIMALATEFPQRFLKLVGYLNPVMQDVFLQYYLLGRTYSQIGAVLFPEKTSVAAQVAVKRQNLAGLKAVCWIIKRGGTSRLRKPERKAAMLDFKPSGGEVRLSAPKSFGQFAINPNGDLSELFSPSWSVLHHRGIGRRSPC